MRPRWRYVVLALVAMAAVYILATFVMVWRASRADHAGPADAIVVLGAAQYDGVPSPVLQGRLDHALELYRQGLAPIIVPTGANQPGDRFTQGFAGYDYLRAQGVPEDALLVIVDGSNTYEELLATANQLLPRELDQVVLVSDPYHALRVDHIAGEVGLDAVVSPTDTGATLRSLLRETAAVSVGRIVSYRRLSSWL
ncbi:MAG: YdcF family protein [Acidimicrobiia bacterium]|nr:YdcF family protein [Acidimicrobiia bacterium]MDH5238071.1 YdcF family protein [Acidimicrobiia bacterium]